MSSIATMVVNLMARTEMFENNLSGAKQSLRQFEAATKAVDSRLGLMVRSGIKFGGLLGGIYAAKSAISDVANNTEKFKGLLDDATIKRTKDMADSFERIATSSKAAVANILNMTPLGDVAKGWDWIITTMATGKPSESAVNIFGGGVQGIDNSKQRYALAEKYSQSAMLPAQKYSSELGTLQELLRIGGITQKVFDSNKQRIWNDYIKDAKNIIDSLTESMEKLNGKSAERMQLEKLLKMEDVSPEAKTYWSNYVDQIERARAVLDQFNKDMEGTDHAIAEYAQKRQAEFDEIARLLKSTRSPLEEYNDNLKRLDDWWQRAMISDPADWIRLEQMFAQQFLDDMGKDTTKHRFDSGAFKEIDTSNISVTGLAIGSHSELGGILKNTGEIAQNTKNLKSGVAVWPR